MATEVTQTGQLAPAAQAERIKEIDTVVAECGLSALNELGQFERTFKLARGVQRLRELISPEMMRDIMLLQGTTLGFRTDKDGGGGYSVDIVKEVTIEASLRGFRMTANETNIIGSRFYGTKEGYKRIVREHPGLSELRVRLSVPRIVNEKGAIVTVSATWKLNNRPDALEEREIPIRVNQGMGADAILGKAERKLYAAIYSQLTGSEQPEGDVGDDTPIDGLRRVGPDANGDNGSGTEGAATPASRTEELNARLSAGTQAKPATTVSAAPDCACPDGPAGTHEPLCALGKKKPGRDEAPAKADDYV